MALVIEDGTGVTDATSYASAADAKAYATARGLSLPSTDAEIEVLLVRAMDLIESRRRRYSGTKTYPAGLQWPRTGASSDGAEIDPSAIPAELKMAQCQAAVDLQTVDPLAATKGPAVRQKTVGPLTTVYAVTDGGSAPKPSMPKVEALLEPLYRSGGAFTVERA